MQGPLVMAATGIKTWDEATIDLQPSSLNSYPSTLIPDYDGDQHLTHYFRLNLPASAAGAIASLPADKSQLRELCMIAKSRSDEQKAWEALAVKVPEYAPWAKHGFVRMVEQMAQAQLIMDAAEDKYGQEEIDKAADVLNAIINTMRPGNLAEVEDLEELKQLVGKAKKQFSVQSTKSNESQCQKAIDYADMVIRYVTDGSGTNDMIERAIKQLKGSMSL